MEVVPPSKPSPAAMSACLSLEARQKRYAATAEGRNLVVLYVESP